MILILLDMPVFVNLTDLITCSFNPFNTQTVNITLDNNKMSKVKLYLNKHLTCLHLTHLNDIRYINFVSIAIVLSCWALLLDKLNAGLHIHIYYPLLLSCADHLN